MKKAVVTILITALAKLLITIASPTAATELPKKLGLGARHQASGLNSSFPKHLQNFEQYVDHYRDVVRRARTDLTAVDRDWIIEGNSPFLLQPESHCQQKREGKDQCGIVFGHGLTDSVYQIRHLAQYFQQQCFYVMALLLPGHGTGPGDMLDVSWEDWVEAMDFAVDQMVGRVHEVYVAGYSTGGTLALLKASRDKRVKGVFAFSPAVKVTGLAIWAGSVDWLGTLFEPIKWSRIMPDADYFKYESFAFNAASQIYQLTKVMEDAIAAQGIDVPVFAVASAEDSTIDAEATVELMKALRHKQNRLLLYSQYPRSEAHPIQVINSHFPEKRQLSLAHTGLSIPADDRHYGRNGRYRSCGHYYDEGNEDYIRCKDDEDIFTGEITEQNLRQGIMRRATYNFLYREMLTELSQFIKDL